MNYSEKTDLLFAEQLTGWELAGRNYELLSKVKNRNLEFDGFSIRLQYNPERMRSSAAKVDTKSIEARPCFLCARNRPEVQKGVTLGDDLTILVNPFPIFRRHLTIPSESHKDQRIAPEFVSMLTVAEALPGFVIFYNGPQCGASAPDHFHFQAGNRGFLPVEQDFTYAGKAGLVQMVSGVELWHWKKYLRGLMTLRGKHKEDISNVFSSFYKKFEAIQADRPEPMLNILAWYEDGYFIVHIFPRKVHRPSQFFAEGEAQILLSPASVDFGGVLILPREEDYYKISQADVEDIFSQVSLSDDEVLKLFL